MGRKRRTDTNWLPHNATVNRGRYIYHPYLGIDKETGKPKYGKSVVLGYVGKTPRAEVLDRYDEAIGAKSGLTLKRLLDLYLASPVFAELTTGTRDQYLKYYRTIVNKPGSGTIFGNVLVGNLTVATMQAYLDKRTSEGAPRLATKELAFMQGAFRWAISVEHDGLDVVTFNPCKGVIKRRANKYSPDERYVEDTDYYHFLFMPGPEYIPLAMEIAYLCRLRLHEVLRLTEPAMLESGLLGKRGKGSKTNITAWSGRLQAVVDRCLTLPYSAKPIRPENRYLIHDISGAPIKESTFETAWQRRAKAFQANGGHRFTFHQIKAKGVSDFEGDKQASGGWVDPKMVLIYDRKPSVVKPTR